MQRARSIRVVAAGCPARAARRACAVPAARGFTLIELLVVIAIVGLLVAVLLPALAGARLTARQAKNVSNIKQMGIAMSGYATDFKDLIASFSAQRPYRAKTEPARSIWPETANSPIRAVQIQAMEIITTRSDWGNPPANVIDNWMVHPTYTHLVIVDYNSGKFPLQSMVSPMDRFRMQMQEDLVGWATVKLASTAPPLNSPVARATWPFSSSYLFTPASFCPDVYPMPYDGVGLTQGSDQVRYQPGEMFNALPPGQVQRYPVGKRRLGEVVFPASKVVVMEDVGRFQNSKVEYPFTHPNAKTTNLTFDGAARALGNDQLAPGGYLDRSGKVWPATVKWDDTYTKWGYCPWPENVPADDPIRTQPGRQRWTVGGLRGMDISTAPNQ